MTEALTAFIGRADSVGISREAATEAFHNHPDLIPEEHRSFVFGEDVVLEEAPAEVNEEEDSEEEDSDSDSAEDDSEAEDSDAEE